MRPFRVVSALDTQQAVALLAEHGARAKLLAGGTDLLVELKAGQHAPEVVIDLSRAGDLKAIRLDDDGLSIGALVTHTELMRAPAVREHFPVLVEAAHTIGALQTRNLGTLGGNLVSAVPSMDSGAALLALEAEVVLAGPAGRRVLPLGEFFRGPRRTALAADELLAEIRIARRQFGKPAAFVKFGLRRGQALALVNAAASLRIARGVVDEPRVALGAVAPTVIRAVRAEAYLGGRAASAEAFAEAGRIAVGEARPISDFRASAEYRRDLIGVLVRRALARALERAGAAR